MLDQAFEALTTYDWGADPNVLKPIDDAIVASHGNADARGQLEARLLTVLTSASSRDAKDYVCRKLMVIGTAASVATLAKLLPQPELSHMARYALERIAAPEARQALRDALGNVCPEVQVGVISSLGVCRDEASVPLLAGMLFMANAAVARAAAFALGDIRTLDAARALAKMDAGNTAAGSACTDALLACAESLLAGGNPAEAMTIYKGFTGENHSKHVRLAATRGMLACAGKSQ
jgi:HEAT repeat protein